MKFNSKRNNVYFENGVVIKEFSSKEVLEIEQKNLSTLKSIGLNVPNIISSNDKSITLQFIEGKNFCDYLEELPLESFEKLAEYIFNFNKITTFNKGDVNLRNFIFTKENEVFAFDFEENLCKGKVETDIGRIISFISTYNPEFSCKKSEIVKIFIDKSLSLGGDFFKIKDAFIKEIEDIINRRNLSQDFLERAITFLHPQHRPQE